MKKFWTLFIFLPLLIIGLSFPASAQDTRAAQSGMARLENELKGKQETPPSRTHKQIKVDQSVTYRLPPPDAIQTVKGKGRPLQIGVVRPFSLNPILKSKWFDLGRVGRVGVFGLVSSGAVQVRVHFTGVDLPRGAKLFVYSMKNPDEIYGPFTGRGPSGDRTLWTPPVEGDGIIVEYFAPGRSPRSKSKPPPFLVSAISHIFRN